MKRTFFAFAVVFALVLVGCGGSPALDRSHPIADAQATADAIIERANATAAAIVASSQDTVPTYGDDVTSGNGSPDLGVSDDPETIAREFLAAALAEDLDAVSSFFPPDKQPSAIEMIFDSEGAHAFGSKVYDGFYPDIRGCRGIPYSVVTRRTSLAGVEQAEVTFVFDSQCLWRPEVYAATEGGRLSERLKAYLDKSTGRWFMLYAQIPERRLDPTAPEPLLTGAAPESPTSALPATTIPSSATIGIHGGKIAFQAYEKGSFEIYVMEADGSNPTRLTDDPAYDQSPAWSPDGQRIAFWSSREDSTDVYVMEADGSNPIRITNPPVDGRLPAWSPNGQQIAFVSSEDQEFEIYVMGADGSNPTRLTNNNVYDFAPVWSPNSQQIAFESSRDGNSEIYVMQADGSNPTRLTNNPADDQSPTWSPDGQQIAFMSNRENGWEVYVMQADGSNPIRLTDTAEAAWSPDWSPDGQ